MSSPSPLPIARRTVWLYFPSRSDCSEGNAKHRQRSKWRVYYPIGQCYNIHRDANLCLQKIVLQRTKNSIFKTKIVFFENGNYIKKRKRLTPISTPKIHPAQNFHLIKVTFKLKKSPTLYSLLITLFISGATKVCCLLPIVGSGCLLAFYQKLVVQGHFMTNYFFLLGCTFF